MESDKAKLVDAIDKKHQDLYLLAPIYFRLKHQRYLARENGEDIVSNTDQDGNPLPATFEELMAYKPRTETDLGYVDEEDRTPICDHDTAVIPRILITHPLRDRLFPNLSNLDIWNMSGLYDDQQGKEVEAIFNMNYEQWHPESEMTTDEYMMTLAEVALSRLGDNLKFPLFDRRTQGEDRSYIIGAVMESRLGNVGSVFQLPKGESKGK